MTTTLSKAATLKAITDLAPVPFVAKPGAGLILNIGPGSAGTLAFAGATVTLPPNRTSSVMLDLRTASLRVLPRAIHRGAVLLATVTTSGNAITAIQQPATFSLPQSRIPRTLNKLRRGMSVRVVKSGDSLFQGSGTGVQWFDSLFSAGQAGRGYNVPGIDNLTLSNIALGGQTAAWGQMMLGQAVQSLGGEYANTAVHYGTEYGARYASGIPASLTPLPVNPVLSGQYDLCIIGFGANGGTLHWPLLEAQVRTLREAGIEVIIGTENFRTDSSAYMFDYGPRLVALADAYGCELVDTWAYVWELSSYGTDTSLTFADVIHMAQRGHDAWAQAMGGVLVSPAPGLDTGTRFGPRILSRELSPQYVTKGPNAAYTAFTPHSTTGTVTATELADADNPAVLLGGKTRATTLTRLTAGQVAKFAHSGAHAVDVLYARSTAWEAKIRSQDGGTVLATISSTASGLPFAAALAEGVAFGTYGDIASGQPGTSNKGIQIECTSGTLDLIGVVFHSYRATELPLARLEEIGTWESSPWLYAPAGRYTDTVGDSVNIPFEGTGVRVLLNGRTAAGVINGWLDGRRVIVNRDLRVGGAFLNALEVHVGAPLDDFRVGYGRHTLRLQLASVAGDAAAAEDHNRRLQVIHVAALDAR